LRNKVRNGPYTINIEIDTNNQYLDPQPNKLSHQFLDQIIVARLSLDPTEPHDELPEDIKSTLNILHFDYLLNCWKQAHDIKKNTLTRSKNLGKDALEQRLEVLNNVKKLLVSYSGLVLQMPEMFTQVQTQIELGPNQLITRLKNQPDTPQGLPSEYLNELVTRFKDDGLDMV
jgi:ubiquitin conjugation factor E4 B